MHTDRLRRISTAVEASENEREIQTLKWESGWPSGSDKEASRGEGAQESTRTETEVARSSGENQENPCNTTPEDAETRRGLKMSAELPIDDPRSEVRGRGLHLDDDADRHVHCAATGCAFFWGQKSFWEIQKTKVIFW